jgi:hypothetical protein
MTIDATQFSELRFTWLRNVESVNGLTRFEVVPASMIEWNWGEL